MRRRRNDPWDQPWVMIAAVVGVIAVVAVAVFFFIGGGSTDSPASPVPATVPATGIKTGGTPTPATAPGSTVSPGAVKEQPTVVVPATGIFVKVSYLGSFNGTYGSGGSTQTARDSGEKVYAVETVTGPVTATFHKNDGSTRHDLVVEIWKDGKAVKIGKTSLAYGEVSVNYQP
jgi:hypothetical protein